MIKKSKKDGTVTVTLTEQELGVIRALVVKGAKHVRDERHDVKDDVYVDIGVEFLLATR